MTTKCFPPILGKRIRVTELDDCGNIIPTSRQIVTDGFVSVSLTGEIEDGTEILVRNAFGALCINKRLPDSFKNFGVEIHFCGVNPSLLSMVSNSREYEDWDGDVSGITIAEGEITGKFALELWTGIAGDECGDSGVEASGYLLLPLVIQGTLGDLEIGGEDAIDFSVANARTQGGTRWGVGPYDVVNGAGGTDEVQTITITGTPTGGDFTLDFKGETTAVVAYNAAAAAVQSALEALPNIDPGDVTVAGGPGPGTPWTVTFGGQYEDEDVPQLIAVGNFTGGSSPAIAVTTTTPGVAGPPAPLPTPLDSLDHLLLMFTEVAPPPAACEPALVTSP